MTVYERGTKGQFFATFYDIFMSLKHPMRFESQTHPQDDHVDRITDCSTRYGQAPAVCTRVRLAKGRWVIAAAISPDTKQNSQCYLKPK